jgi:DeoR family deoxyribose operon repressor
MTKNERLRALADTLREQSVVRLREAATLLDVSEMTVRRDIAASPGMFTYLGGYIVRTSDVPNHTHNASYTIDAEQDHFAQAKAQASATAARLLADNDTVFIDCGTTLTTLARMIPMDLHLTVVCYSLNIAEILRHKSSVRMILLGGVYAPSSDSFASEESIDTLKRMGINKAFMSAGGVDGTRGVTCWNFHEVAIKQAAMASAVEKHLVIDTSKIGKVKAVRYAPLGDFDSLITERGQALRPLTGQ